MSQLRIEQAIGIAIGHHQAGRLAEAEGIYRQVLAQSPTHADALHLLGVLAYQTDHPGAAVDLIGRAIAINPAVSEYHSNLGESYRRAGHWEKAIASLRRAIELKPDLADAHINLSTVLRDQGWLDEAIAALNRAIALKPESARAYSNLGVTLVAKGRLDEAIAAYRRAIQFKPDLAEAHNNLGIALKDQGRLDEAIAAYRRAIQFKPDYPEAHNNLGIASRDQGRLDEAIVVLDRAIALRPDYAKAHNNLGLALSDQGERNEAVAAYHRAIAFKPDLAEAHHNLGNALWTSGRPDEAIAAYHCAIALEPDYAEAHNNLGIVLKDQGRLDEAVAAYHRAIALRPDLAEAYNNLGIALKEQGRPEEAITAFHRALALRDDDAKTYSNLGMTFQETGRLDEAIATLGRAIALGPDLAEAHNNLGSALRETGRLDEAITAYRRALALKSNLAEVYSNLLFSLHFHPDLDAQAILAEHRHWAAEFAAPLGAEIQPHTNNRFPDRKLRIGFVSPDLYGHPVGQLLLPLFSHHDRAQTQFFAYSDVLVPDPLTRKLKDLADGWRDAERLSDSDLSDRIRDDRIDILVDLALHTAHNRLLVFARKPAPVQVTMLGLPTTTGLATIDYRLTDTYLDPPCATDADYAERSIRLPHCFWCYEPREGTPPVSTLPEWEKGHVTFGCLNHFAKVSRAALLLWVKILQRLPGARLVLYSPHGSHRDVALALLGASGIAPDRVEFDARVPPLQYLRRYHDLDLALDPFPHSGGTTTMDALWMGVPVVTLAGRTAVGRGGVSILSNAGLPELIARTPEEYVAIAVALACDRPRLAALRKELRPRILASPLADGRRYAADVEAAFRRMWHTWCAS